MYMKKDYSHRILLSLLLILAGAAQGWAGESNTYYAKLTAIATPTGAGKVYVSTEKSPESYSYSETSSASGSTNVSWGYDDSDPGKADVTFYAFAQANDGYRFKGWADSQTGNVTSTSIPYTATVTSNSSTETSPTSQTVYAQFVKIVDVTITFLAPQHGSYTASDGSKTITDNGTITTQNAFTLKATPESGYKIYGWYTTTDGGKTKRYFSTATTVTGYTFTESTSVGVDFVTTGTPVFIVIGNTTPYSDLNAADKAAGGSGTIVPISDATLPAGNYTISKGNTLLIPYDDSYTEETTKPTVTQTWTVLSAYKTLHLADGASITVSNGGAICVAGQMFSTSNRMSTSAGGPGTPTGAFGCISMKSGGKITLESGAKLYAWGFITGQNKDEGNNTSGVGTIEAQNGSVVYEDFVIGDWHGGSATIGFSSSKKFFPFNQYFIPNIEVPMTVSYGATVNTYCNISAGLGSSKSPYDIPINNFIAKSDGLFNITSEGSTIKTWYDATTDEQHFDFDGDVTIGSLSINLAGYVTVDSKSYVLPLTSSMNMRINSGTFTASSDMAILPCAKVTVGDDATADISSNLYVYDLDNWDGYAYTYQRICYPYRPTAHYTATTTWTNKTGMTDAKVEVNGTLNMSDSLYTTAAGADICSNGYGKINFTKAPTATATTYQVKDLSTETAVSVTAAQLHNADGTYEKTAGASAGTAYYYDPNEGKWQTDKPTGPSFSYDEANRQVKLDKSYLVTSKVAETFNSAITSAKGNNSVLSADITKATGTIDIAAVRTAIGATDQNNVLLYAPSAASAGDAQNVIVDGKAANLVIADAMPMDVPTAFTAEKLTYNRSSSGWGTVCVPYAQTANGDLKFYQFGSLSKDGKTMYLTEVSSVAAYEPAIFNGSIGYSGSDVAISATPASLSANGLVGVLTNSETLPKGSSYYYIAGGKFWQPTKNAVTVNPQRAYFGGGSAGAKVLSIGISDDAATGIGAVESAGPTVEGVYTLGGARLNGLRRGVNIVKLSDGTTRKIVVK